MMKKSLGWLFALCMVTFAWSAAPAKKAPAKKSATAKKSKRSAVPARNSKRSGVSWRNRQMAPSADRYKEIQGALAAKGYLQAENVTGTWDAASMDGMKRFQNDQKIDATGKINSLSLIALGLGPKHESAPTAPEQASTR